MDKQPSSENVPLPEPEPVMLRDGTTATIRPIRPDDAQRLQEGFTRLSAETIFFRFLDYRKELSDTEAAQLASVNYRTQMAFVASLEIDGVEHIIGVARYAVPDLTQPDPAEVAVLVGDRCQGRGLGTIVLDRLIKYARREGIRAFVATVRHENERVLRFIQRSGFPVESEVEGPARKLRVNLTKSSETVR